MLKNSREMIFIYLALFTVNAAPFLAQYNTVPYTTHLIEIILISPRADSSSASMVK